MREIQDFVSRERGNLLSFLKDLIAIESISGNEEAVVKRAAEEMRACGFDEVFFDSMGNVIGRIGSGEKIILFDAHLDTVEVDKERWNSDPFTPVEKDGKIYGRGAVDDKGSFACLVYAGKALKELDLEHSFTVYITGSISEEDCEGLAVGSFLEEYNIKPDYTVIAEASECTICRGHRGRALVEAQFRGTPVHASIHDQGENPIEKALPFIKAIQELDKSFPEDGPLGSGDAAVTNVSCRSISLNTLPSGCTVVVDRRLTTRDSRESVLEEMKYLPGAGDGEIRYIHYKEKSYNGYPKETEEYFPSWVIDEQHELVTGASECFRELYGTEPVVKVWGFSTNGNYTMGSANIPTIGFGPGRENQAHADNEHVEIEQLIKAVPFFAYLPLVMSK